MPQQAIARASRIRTTTIRAAVLAALLPALQPAHALSYSWVGGAVGTPTSWNNILNWQPQLRPRSASDTVLLFQNAFVATNDIADNFQFNRISAFAGSSGPLTGTILGQTLMPAGADAQIAVGGSGVLAINASLVGSGAWSKTGTGELALGGTNVGASGEINVAAGRLSALNSGNLGSGAVTVAAGATLKTGGTQAFGGIAGAGSWLADGSVTLNPAGGERRLDGPVSGTASLQKTGAGRQVFGGQVALAGAVTVGAGELALSGRSASWSGSTAVTVSNAARATLSGGATWNTLGSLLVSGSAGSTATLALSGGSSFAAAAGVVGRFAGEGGAVTLDGGSNWANSGGLTIGALGLGSVGLTNGSTASAQSVSLGGSPDSFGSLSLAGGSSLVTGEAYFGGSGRGAVSVGAQSALSTADTWIGDQPGSQGTVSLTGPGSRWTAGSMTVGSDGRGTVVVSGGTVDAVDTRMGTWGGSEGRIMLTDASSWSNTYSLTVGLRGTASLVLDTGSSMSAFVVGIGSGGGNGQVSLDHGASLVVGRELYVGGSGRGTLVVQRGSTVTSGLGYVGLHREYGNLPGSSSVLLDGGSWAVAGELRVGGGGKGSVTLSNGATLTSGTAVLAHASDSVGNVLLGGGSATDRWTNAAELTVGGSGAGTLTLLGRASARSGSAYLGWYPGASGSVVLGPSGADLPTFDIDGVLYISGSGLGTLQLGGGSLNSGPAAIGVYADSSGSATVRRDATAAQARWVVAGGLTVGSAEGGRTSGQLTVDGGGEVNVSDTLTVAPGGVVGLGDGGRLAVGSLGPIAGRLNWTGGTLAITGPDGATLGSTPLLGRVLSLAGAQALEVTQRLSVGNATIVLADQAQVRSGLLGLSGGQIVGTAVQTFEQTLIIGYGTIAVPVDASASSSINAQGGLLSIGDANRPNGFRSAGWLTADLGARLVLASGSEVSLPGAALYEGSSLESFNGLRLGPGAVLQAWGNATVRGPFTNDGSVIGPARAGELLSFNDDVAGSGRFTGNVRFRQLYAPGAGAALQHMSLAPTATLALVGLGAPARTGSSLLEVAGLATLGGLLDLQFTPGYTPDAGGGSFVLVDWGSYSGTFAGLVVEGLADGWTAQLSYDADALRLSVSAVPEPAAWLTMLAGAAILSAARRAAPAAIRRRPPR